MSRFLFIIIFTLLCLASWAQKYSFIGYSTSEGLPQSQVNAIAQDNSGYLWVATFGGLTKFDGTRFTSYGKSDGLLNNRTVELSYVNDTLFIGHDKGISYSCAADSFCTASYPDEIAPANVTSIVDFKGRIFVGTNGSGCFEFQPESGNLLPIDGSPSRVRQIQVFQDKMYFATRFGLFVSNDGKKFSIVDGSADLSFSSLYLKNETIYTTTYNGLLLSFGNNHQLDTVFKKDRDPFRSVILDHKNNFWINSKNGVICIKENEVIQLTEKTGLPINDINTTFQDKEGNIWLGTGGKGLIRFTGEVFTYFNDGALVPSDIVISMARDPQDNLWLSTYDKGVYQINKNGESKHIDYITSSVWSMDVSQEHLVLGSNFGLHVFYQGTWNSYYEEDGLSSNRIRGVKKIADSIFLIGTSQGIERFHANSGTLTSLINKETTLSNVRDFVVKNDTIFIAAQSGVFTFSQGRLSNLYQLDAGINCIELDDFNNLWLGTENGLFIERNKKLQRKALEDNNRNDYINFIRKVDGHIFVGTNNGVFELDIKDSTQYHYDINKGLIDLETNLNASMYDEENQSLWFGTASGLMKMDLENRMELFESASPHLQLTAIKVNFDPITDIRKFKKDQKEGAFSIPYKDNNISFEFDGIYLSNPSGLRYQYFLKGFSSNWSPLMKNPDINFTNLPPGEYTLLFRAKNDVGLFSDEWETHFEILPPFYRTWWFYSAVAILIVLILFMIDRIRVARLARKNYRMRLEFENKLSKLEQQSLNASMNRHFIFNSLNSIQYYINSSDKSSANKYLSRFAKLIRKNLDSSHRKDGMVALGDEIDRLQLYLDLESMRFKDKFDYKIEIDPHVEIEMLKVPAMFLQPFVENSIIHGILPLKDRKGLITIRIKDHLDHIRIEIEDNGVGIEHSVKGKTAEGDHESQGMLITKGRIELLQKISARSIEMIGPHQINENDSSINGTIVIFKLVKQYLD